MRWFWIDRFTEFVRGSHAVAVKGVSLSEDHMHEHMVGYPIMPNSLVTEGMAQAGGLLVSEQYGSARYPIFMKLASVTARRGQKNAMNKSRRSEVLHSVLDELHLDYEPVPRTLHGRSMLEVRERDTGRVVQVADQAAAALVMDGRARRLLSAPDLGPPEFGDFVRIRFRRGDGGPSDHGPLDGAGPRTKYKIWSDCENGPFGNCGNSLF